MAKRPAASRNDTPLCPDCRSEVTFVASWTVLGLWGYKGVQTWECSTHGPVFIGAEDPITRVASQTPGRSFDGGDRESLIPARRGPKPILKSGAIAVAEPDSD
jgi:hypothetical protein